MTRRKLDNQVCTLAIIGRRFPDGKLRIRLNASVLPRQMSPVKGYGMSRAGIRVVSSSAKVQRPIGLALLSGTGVACGLSLTVLAMALIAYKASLGIPLATQIIEITLAILVPFTIVWVYWGLWDIMQSAWWSHVIGGPLAIAGLGAALVWRHGITGLLARGLPIAVHPLVATSFTWLALGLLFLEIATVVYLLTAWKVFGIGAPKPLWERRR